MSWDPSLTSSTELSDSVAQKVIETMDVPNRKSRLFGSGILDD